jgi:hypothetical protein
MMTILRMVLAAVAVAVASGCTVTAPNYASLPGNVDAASKLPGKVAVGTFTFKAGEEATLNKVGARADSFNSPTHGSYAEYMQEAAKSDLRAAGKLDDSSQHVLTGVVERNDLSAASLSTNDAHITVRFKLAQGTRVDYERAITADHEWESAILGAVAIPRAIQNYVVTLQQLLLKLYTDPEFAGAVGKH